MPGAKDLGAIGSGGAFRGFTAAEFDAFAPKKWSSNAFTLERRRAKDSLLALARAIERRLTDPLSGLELGASDEAPTVANSRKVEAQWAFFTRGAEDRAALRTLLQRTDLQEGAGLFDIAVQHQHACLMLRLDVRGFTISFEMATKARVDRDNACEKLRQGWARDKLLEIARALPSGSVLGFATQGVGAVELSAESLEAWLDPLSRGEQLFSASVLFDRADDVMSSASFIDVAATHLGAFVPLYRFLAWTRENDHTQVKGAIQKEMADRQKRAPSLEPGDRVTILSGLFAGRSGYLAELDGKGRAKVMVGPVSVTVDAKDLKSS